MDPYCTNPAYTSPLCHSIFDYAKPSTPEPMRIYSGDNNNNQTCSSDSKREPDKDSRITRRTPLRVMYSNLKSQHKSKVETIIISKENQSTSKCMKKEQIDTAMFSEALGYEGI